MSIYKDIDNGGTVERIKIAGAGGGSESNVKCTTLFESTVLGGNTTGTYTNLLSDSVDNFDEIEIIFRSVDNYQNNTKARVNVGNTTILNMNISIPGPSYAIEKQGHCKINGKNVVVGSTLEMVAYHNSVTYLNLNTNGLFITKITGIKYL